MSTVHAPARWPLAPELLTRLPTPAFNHKTHCDADPSLLPPRKASRLVASTGLSFCRKTREEFPTLQPPDDAVYLSNMAVDSKLRRQGLARLMLQTAEALAASRGFKSIYLHARLSDAPAQQLYLTSGYQVVDKDMALVAKVRGITPRVLMQKSLL